MAWLSLPAQTRSDASHTSMVWVMSDFLYATTTLHDDWLDHLLKLKMLNFTKYPSSLVTCCVSFFFSTRAGPRRSCAFFAWFYVLFFLFFFTGLDVLIQCASTTTRRFRTKLFCCSRAALWVSKAFFRWIPMLLLWSFALQTFRFEAKNDFLYTTAVVIVTWALHRFVTKNWSRKTNLALAFVALFYKYIKQKSKRNPSAYRTVTEIFNYCKCFVNWGQ